MITPRRGQPCGMRQVITIATCMGAFSPACAQNLLANGDFESRTVSPWTGGACTIFLNTADTFTGTGAASCWNRSNTFAGHRLNIAGTYPTGTLFRASGAFRPDGVNADVMTMKLGTIDAGGAQKTDLVSRAIVDPSEWRVLEGLYQLDYQGAMPPTFRMVLSTRELAEDFSIDDFSVEVYEEDPNWRATANAGIEQHRKRDMVVNIVDVHGNSVAGDVHLRLTEHEFRFGGTFRWNELENQMLNPDYGQIIAELFNTVTPRFRLKWRAHEQTRNVLTWDRSDFMMQFAQENDLEVFGHTIYWDFEKNNPGSNGTSNGISWLRGLPEQEFRDELYQRAVDIIGRYGEQIKHWDVVNESLHASFYEDQLNDPTINATLYKWVDQLAPDAKLYFNDYNLIAGDMLGGDAQWAMGEIARLQSLGAKIDAIGAQGHFSNKQVNARWLRNRLDLLASAGLPIRITEFDIDEPDVQARADAYEKVYRVAFSHPSVEGVTMWGWYDGNSGPQTHLYEVDFAINAAGERYRDMVLNEWMTDVTTTTDANGVVNERGFHGEYSAAFSKSGYDTRAVSFVLPSEADTPHEVEIIVIGTCIGDIDVSGVSDFFDLSGYLSLASAGDDRADIDGLDGLDMGDVFEAVNALTTGCAE